MCAALLVAVAGCVTDSNDRPSVLVFAAISLTDALTQIEREFEAQSGVDVSISYGGSQMLAQQIARGAPADLFIAAGRFPVEFLMQEDLVESEPVNIVANELVLVTQSSRVPLESMSELATDAVDRVAVADPDLAPAGRYARESLTHLGLWDELEGKLVTGSNVRITLAYVEAGNVDVAIVYRTDAAAARGVTVLDVVPSESYSKIAYPAVVIRKSEKKAHARQFLDFLSREPATGILRERGFEPLGR